MRSVPKVVLASAGAVLLVGGLAAGAAFAQTPPGQAAQSSWLTKFAQALGKTPTEVQQASKTASTQVIDEAVQAGRLTQEQAQRLKDRIAQAPLDGQHLFGPRGFGRGHGMKGARGDMGIMRQAETALAQYFGIQPQDLQTQLRSGKSLAQIAQEHGKSRTDLKSYITTEAKTRLDQAVADGKLTQQQADSLLQRLASNLDQMIDRSFQPGQRGPRPNGQQPNGPQQGRPSA